jgi:quercetin dioxygenase-like cupin family protein
LRQIQPLEQEENMQVHSWSELEWEQVTHDISRKVITGKNEMIAQIFLKKDALVPEHSHVSEQISYVVEGALKFWVGGKELILNAGQVLVIPPNVPHKALALEDTLDIDIFSPVRQDWLDHTDTYFHRR